MEKGEIAHHEQFLLLPQCFQKSSAKESLRLRLYVRKGLDKLNKIKITLPRFNGLKHSYYKNTQAHTTLTNFQK